MFKFLELDFGFGVVSNFFGFFDGFGVYSRHILPHFSYVCVVKLEMDRLRLML